MGPSHDQEIIHELFSNVLHAGKLLTDDDPLLASVDSALSELAMPGIGSDGRIMEWREEFPEDEPDHRHVSHLYMLHPGNIIDPQKTPELAEAARKSLEARTDNGTGWSLAWKVNLWARLYDGERSYRLLKNVLRPIDPGNTRMSNAGGTYENLFCGHPPFQIDGNFGATSGIGEMLLQSHIPEDDTWIINLLPSLPSAWSEGEIRGLRARGGFEVNMKWANGLLSSCEIKSVSGKKLRVKYGDKDFSSEVSPGDIYIFSGDLILKKRKHTGI
jgi:alpha-L-fucosidase 2